MIYIDFQRGLVATEKTVVDQIKGQEAFQEYCRNNWLFFYNDFSSCLKSCLTEVIEDRGYEDIEEVIISEDLPTWGYEEVQLVLAKDWLLKEYSAYTNPNSDGEIFESEHYLWLS